VSHPIGDRTDQGFGFSEQFENAPGQIDVTHVVAATDVVHLAGGTSVDQEVHRPAMIRHVQPVALLQPVPIQRDRNVVDGVCDEEGN
jgi:hypothetical protein